VRPRTTALWLGVALLVAAALYWSERGPGGDDVASGELLFPDLRAEDVRWLHLEGMAEPSGPGAPPPPPVHVERHDGGWRVVEPVSAPADDVTLDGMASTLAGLASERALQGAEAPAVYGLGEEAPVLRFAASGGAPGDRGPGLRFGDRAPVGASSYVARLDRPEQVHVVSTWRLRSLRRTLDELRDRRVLPFDLAAVRSLELRWRGGGVTVVRSTDGRSEGFQLLSPFVAEADDGVVANLLSDLAYLRAEDFVDAPDEADRAELEAPAFEAELRLEDGGPLHLALSEDEVAPGQRLARGRDGAFFRVAAEQLDLLPRTVGAYRFKQLASFDAGRADTVRWRFGDRELRTERTAGGDWRLAGDEATALAPAYGNAVAELAHWSASDIELETARDLQLEVRGLRPPRLVVVVEGREQDDEQSDGEGQGGIAPRARLAEIEVGRADADGLPVRVPGRAPVYRVEPGDAGFLPADPDDFRARYAASPVEAPAEEADLVSGEEESDDEGDDEGAEEAAAAESDEAAGGEPGP